MPFQIKNPNDANDICRALYSVDASLRAVVERVASLERRAALLEDETGALKREISDCHKAIEGFSSSVLSVLMAAQKGLTDSLGTTAATKKDDAKVSARVRLALVVGIVITGLTVMLERLGYDLQVNWDGLKLEKHAPEGKENEGRDKSKTEKPPA